MMELVRHPLPAQAEELRAHFLELLGRLREAQHKQLSPIYERLRAASGRSMQYRAPLYEAIAETSRLHERQAAPILKALSDIDSIRQVSYVLAEAEVRES